MVDFLRPSPASKRLMERSARGAPANAPSSSGTPAGTGSLTAILSSNQKFGSCRKVNVSGVRADIVSALNEKVVYPRTPGLVSVGPATPPKSTEKKLGCRQS